MSNDAYTRVGRGGSGNFWSKEDIATAEKMAKEDLEAQNISGPVTTDVLPPPEWVPTGRGGAYNHVSPAQLSAESKEIARVSKEGISPMRKAIEKAASVRPVHQGFSGRGGAGNHQLADEEEERARLEEEEQMRMKKVNERVLLDVENMMKPPPKAHAAPESYDRSTV